MGVRFEERSWRTFRAAAEGDLQLGAPPTTTRKIEIYTVMERALEELSFPAPDRGGENVVVDEAMVLGSLGDLAEVTDVSRYVL